jgi:hypothetical protein
VTEDRKNPILVASGLSARDALLYAIENARLAGVTFDSTWWMTLEGVAEGFLRAEEAVNSAAGGGSWDFLCLRCAGQHSTQPDAARLATRREAQFAAQAHTCPRRMQLRPPDGDWLPAEEVF